MSTSVISNPWAHLAALTPARIAQGRSGISLPTKAHLAFQFDHASARSAVYHQLDQTRLGAALQDLHPMLLQVASAAADRACYLQRPDLGRRLAPQARDVVASAANDGGYDVAFVLADGLSALAIETNALPFLRLMLQVLADAGWSVAPLVMASQARVAIGDEIGDLLGARQVVVMIGERPGLSSPDSMGLYFTHAPRIGLTDEARNCISNIRPQGMSYAEACHKLWYLMREARRRDLSGVDLKEEAEALSVSSELRAAPFLLGA